MSKGADSTSDGPWHGQGKDIHAALEDAWEHAKYQGAKPGRYTVESIEVECQNPISTYHVKIAK